MTGDSRGVSEVVGYVLIVGIVAVMSVGVALAGGAVLDDTRAETDTEAAGDTAAAVEDRLDTVASTQSDETQFETRGVPGRVGVRSPSETGARMHVSVSADGQTCSVRTPLSAVEYERDGKRIAVQAGGRFVQSPGGSTTVRSPPSVRLDDGTLDVTTYTLSGTIDSDQESVRLDRNATARRSEELASRLSQGACRRPSTANVTVSGSSYQSGWAQHFRRNTPASVTVSGSNVTATFDDLSRSADDGRNDVIDLDDPSHATVDPSTGNVTVDKGANNTYYGTFRPVGPGTQHASVTNLTTSVPTDTVLAIDTTGSMASEIDFAHEASKAYVGQQDPDDRVAVVSWDTTATVKQVGTSTFSSNSGKLNDTIDFDAEGKTIPHTGYEAAIDVLRDHGDPNHQKRIVLFTDGKAEPPDSASVNASESRSRTLTAARTAASRGIQTYTVGYTSGADSSNVNSTMLDRIAGVSGGKSTYPANRSELIDAFVDASKEGETVHTRRPVQIRSYVTNRTYDPTYPTDGSFPMGVNSATVRGEYSLTAAQRDGEPVHLTSSVHDCAAGTGGAGGAAPTIAASSSTGSYARPVRLGTCGGPAPGTAKSTSASDVSIYFDGTSVSTIDAAHGDALPWEASLTELLRPHLVDTDGDGSGDELDLQSNQAIYVVDLPDGDGASRLVLLYEVGSPEETARPVVELRHVTATVGDE